MTVAAFRSLADLVARVPTQRRRSVPWPTQGQRPFTPRDTYHILTRYRGWVYDAVTVIGNRVSEVPSRLTEVVPLGDGKEEREPIAVHPFYDLLGHGGNRKPNPLTTRGNFLKLTQADLDLVGDAYWFKVRDAFGIPRELWRLRPDKMNPVIDREGMLLGWVWAATVTSGELTAVTFPVQEVVHFQYPNPLGWPYLGMSPVRAMWATVETDEANKLYQRTFFSKGAHLSMIVSTDQPLDETQVQMVLDNFEARHSGVENAWMPVVLGHGLKAAPSQAINKDLQALDLMAFTRDEILATYAVPRSKLGQTDAGITRANADAADVTFNREAINPRLRNIEETVETQLIVDYPQPSGNRRLEYDFDNPVPEDRDYELRAGTELKRAGALTVNELRERHGLPAFEGEYGEMVEVSTSASLVDPRGDGLMLGAPPPEEEPDEEPEEPEEPEEDEEEAPEEGDEEAEAFLYGDTRSPTPPWHDPAMRDLLRAQREGRRQRWELLANGKASRALAVQRKAAFAALSRLYDRVAHPSATEVIEAITPALTGEKTVKTWRRMAKVVIDRVFRVEAVMAKDLAESRNARQTAPFSWQSAALRHLAQRENRLTGALSSRFDDVVAVMRATMFDPEFDGGSATVARALSRAFGLDSGRALMIARTEIGSAMNAAAQAGYVAGGATHKGWLSARDDRVRDSHQDVDGEIVPIEQAFSNGLMHPSDPNGPPEEVINCRCTETPEFAPA